MGLDEVARIKKRMQKIMDEENFTGSTDHACKNFYLALFWGTAAEFGKFLGDQEQFKFQGPDDVKQHYEKMCAHIETLLPQYFSVFPENDLVIKTDTVTHSEIGIRPLKRMFFFNIEMRMSKG